MAEPIRSAAPNAFIFSMSRLLADYHGHALASGVDSTGITLQPASRMIPSTLQPHNRGAAEINVKSRRSADITPELTGREESNQAFNLANERQAHSAPVE
jgi:hypothetical protein